MCLAIPARVVSIKGTLARVEVMGNARQADLSLLDDVAIGDYILVHAGFGIQKLDRSEAEETLAIFRSLEEGIGEDAEP